MGQARKSPNSCHLVKVLRRVAERTGRGWIDLIRRGMFAAPQGAVCVE